MQLILYTMPDVWRSESSRSLGSGKRLLMVCCGLQATLTFCCFKMRPIFSETPCTYSSTTKPLKLSTAGCLVNALSQFRIKDMGQLLSRRTAFTRCVALYKIYSCLLFFQTAFEIMRLLIRIDQFMTFTANLITFITDVRGL